MLSIEHIDVCYGDLQALWDVSLFVQSQEIVALVGSNGAGKSTLLETICGFLRPRAGTITFDGIDLTSQPPHRIVESGICMVPEGRRLFPEMSVLENLKMGAFASRARQEMAKTIEQVYEIFPILKDRKNQLSGKLSGGEQEMLAIGRGLMSRPKLLLLDEVSSGIAPALVEELFQVIKQINMAGVTILLVEQNVYLALGTANRAYIIENGRIFGVGEAKALLSDERVKSAYLGLNQEY